MGRGRNVDFSDVVMIRYLRFEKKMKIKEIVRTTRRGKTTVHKILSKRHPVAQKFETVENLLIPILPANIDLSKITEDALIHAGGSLGERVKIQKIWDTKVWIYHNPKGSGIRHNVFYLKNDGIYEATDGNAHLVYAQRVNIARTVLKILRKIGAVKKR